MATTIDQATYDHVQPVLLGYAQRAVRQPELAQELVQESWLAALRHIDSFDGRASLRSWMVGILKHKIVDHFRRAAREAQLDVAPESSVAPEAEPSLDRQRAATIAREGLTRLPPLQRAAVELCDVRGLDRDETARELGVERGHLRVLLHRGRQRLREELQSAGVFGPT